MCDVGLTERKMMSPLDSTNWPDVFSVQLNCKKNRDLLWFLYHEGRTELKELKSAPDWHIYKNIFIVDQECRTKPYELDDERIHLWDSTVSDHPRIFTYLFWYDWVRLINQETKLTDRLLSVHNKKPQYLFDALLGVLRDNKQFVLDTVESSDLRQQILLGTKNHLPDVIVDDWVPGGDFDTKELKIEYISGQKANVDCFVPYEIYNQSWYTIVCETRPNGSSFFTEKSAKPLIAGRLFVFFGNKGFLRDLRRLGFRTFGQVIDESYDEIDDDGKRWSMAWQQVEYLSRQDPVRVYDSIKSVIEHNRMIISTRNYTDIMLRQIKKLLTSA